jgi:hypothetical protein
MGGLDLIRRVGEFEVADLAKNAGRGASEPSDQQFV